MQEHQYPVSASDLFNYIAGYHISEQQIGCVLTFGDPLDAELLAKAIRRTLDLEPVLGCRFVEDPVQPCWTVREDLESVTLLTLQKVSGTEGLETYIEAYFAEPFDRPRSPLIQARLFRGEADTLCVKIFHACSDGRGVKNYVDLLGSAYTELQEGVPHRSDRRYGLLRDQGPLFEALGITDAAAAFDPSRMRGAEWMFPSSPGTRQNPRLAIRRLNAEAFRNIHGYAHKHGATINDVLTAALYRGLFLLADFDHEQPQTASITIDLRRFLPEDTMAAVCNLSGMGYLSLPFRPSETFTETLSRCQEQLNAWKQDLPGLQTAISMELIARAGYGTALAWLDEQARKGAAEGRAVPGLTNFGRISRSPLRFGSSDVTDAYMLSPLQYAPNFALGASTYNDVLSLTIGYFEPETSSVTVDRFLDALTDELARIR
ncbi:hypothetical protein P4H65_24490 [Paenibacillus chitinolyticus]|uniref:hypothetical protein n=1 Tax=Paenibacillus chitinolyticus TaxID=79263 RepID=UPI002DB97E1E|nr:hypothetical protein [Paenibacillus chitinolyticus]MEC0248954.1 hypothetical protein [Paenibacillus chitinolyticus]